MGLGGIAALGVVAVAGIYGVSAVALRKDHAEPPHAFDASGGNVTEGGRLAQVYGCTECHTADLGGMVLIDGMPFGRVAAPNLTNGRAEPLTDEQFEQSVRHGVGVDGRALFIMPSADYTYLSDREVADILAYIRSLPAVERDLPVRSFGPIGRMLIATGKLQFQPELIARDPDARHLQRPGGDDPVQLGHYLTRMCTGCHGRDLAGAPPMEPGGKPSANLTALQSWSADDFRAFFRTGRTPDGRTVGEEMPWQVIGKAQPAEIDAIFAYLQTLEPKPTQPVD
jgi:mono/diheme cytochrome c family protein